MLAAVLLIAQQPKTLTFTHPCAHSSVVLEALGKEIGAIVRPSGSVSQDYFAVKLTNVPIEEAKRVIAEALNAEWLQKETILYLDRNAKQHLKEKKDEDDALRESIARYLNDRKDNKFDIELIKKKVSDATAVQKSPQVFQQELNAIYKLLPTETLGPKIVKAIGVEKLIALNEGDSLVYTLAPDGANNMPVEILKAVRDYARECEELNRLTISIASEQIASYLSSRPEEYVPDVRITASRGSGNITIYIAESASIANRGSYSSNRSIGSFSSRLASGPRATIPKLTGVFAVEGEAVHVFNVVRMRMQGLLPVQQPGTQQDVLYARRAAADLVRNELLANHGDAPLRLMVAQTRRDYVALLPDAIAYSHQWLSSAPGRDLDSVWKSWSGSLIVTEDEKTKILKVRPFNTKRERAVRFDRAATSRFVANFNAVNRVSLESLAGFASAFDSSAEFLTNLSVARVFLPISISQYGEWVALKTYAGLGGTQKRQAREGGVVVPWLMLPINVRKDIELRLLRQMSMYTAQSPESVNWSSAGSYSFTGTPVFKILSAVPSGTTVRITVLKNTLLKPAPPSRVFSETQVMSAEEIAYAQRTGTNEFTPDYKLATVANIERVQLELSVPGSGYTSYAAQVDDTTLESTYVPLNQLPEPWRSQVADAIKRRGG